MTTMNFQNIKQLGKKLSKKELNLISGGASIHGSCNNGNHFTFLIRVGMDVDQVINDINMTICEGSGLDLDTSIIR